MRLVADDAVHHLRAHSLQPLRPVDVRFFVKTSLQLDDHHHFLAAPRCLDQEVHQLGLAAGAIDRLLDRQHVRVFNRFAQQLHHRLEALKRVMQHHIALGQAIKHRFAARQPPLRPDRLVRQEAQLVGLGLVDQLIEADQVHRAIDAVQRGRRQVELLQQKA